MVESKYKKYMIILNGGFELEITCEDIICMYEKNSQELKKIEIVNQVAMDDYYEYNFVRYINPKYVMCVKIIKEEKL